jgi:gas vesicle protein
MGNQKNECCNSRKGVCIGSFIGVTLGVIGATTYFLKTPSGKKTLNYVIDKKDRVLEGVQFIQENRLGIMDQIKETTNKVSDTVKSVKDDIKTISECTTHLKESSTELIEVAQESLNDLKKLKIEEKNL